MQNEDYDESYKFVGQMTLYRNESNHYIAEIRLAGQEIAMIDVPPHMAAMLPQTLQMLKNG